MLIIVARLVNAQDLGQAGAEEVVDEEKAAERIALVRTQTQASGTDQEGTRSKKDGPNRNLLSCIFIVLKEQGHLWKCFILLAIATIIGGKNTDEYVRFSLTVLQVLRTRLKPFYSLE